MACSHEECVSLCSGSYPYDENCPDHGMECPGRRHVSGRLCRRDEGTFAVIEWEGGGIEILVWEDESRISGEEWRRDLQAPGKFPCWTIWHASMVTLIGLTSPRSTNREVIDPLTWKKSKCGDDILEERRRIQGILSELSEGLLEALGEDEKTPSGGKGKEKRKKKGKGGGMARKGFSEK